MLQVSGRSTSGLSSNIFMTPQKDLILPIKMSPSLMMFTPWSKSRIYCSNVFIFQSDLFWEEERLCSRSQKTRTKLQSHLPLEKRYFIITVRDAYCTKVLKSPQERIICFEQMHFTSCDICAPCEFVQLLQYKYAPCNVKMLSIVQRDAFKKTSPKLIVLNENETYN